MTPSQTLTPGFADPVHECQRTFRAVLDALARPGRIESVPGLPEPVPGLGPASAAIALALIDFETPVWLDPACSQAAAFLRFHCGCPIVKEPKDARFAFAQGFLQLPPLSRFSLGSDVAPQDSTTLVVEVEALSSDGPWLLSGPGIERQHRLGVTGMADERRQERDALAEGFPCGIDLLLTQGRRVVGLPRTTRIQTSRSEACMSR